MNNILNHLIEEGLVSKAEQILFNSAVDYAGEKGLLDIVLIQSFCHTKGFVRQRGAAIGLSAKR